MKKLNAKKWIVQGVVLALIFSGCASKGTRATVQQYDKPPAAVQGADKKLFLSALKAQNAGQYEPAVRLWKSYLAKNPNSFEGHNNLGMVYYTQDRVSQALQEFETAHRLEPVDPKIRANLARALRFKANMFHENREYFKTLEIMARLEKIVTPEEVQGVLMKMEQVEDQIFIQVMKSDDVSAYLDFVQRFPDGLNAVRANEYLEKHPKQVSKAKRQKKNSKPNKHGMSRGVESGSFASGGSSQVLPNYGAPSSYESAQASATYTPPSAQPVTQTSKKKKFDIFGVDPTAAEEGVTEETVTASQAADTMIIVPSDDFTKPGRIDGKSDALAMGNSRVGEDPLSRTEPEVLADQPDTRPDLEAPQVEVAETPAPDIQLEQVAQEETPVVEAEATDTVPAVEDEPVMPEAVIAEAAPAVTAEPAEMKMAEQESAKAQPEESPVEELAPSAIERAIMEAEAESAEAPPVDSSIEEPVPSAIEQAIMEAEAEMAQTPSEPVESSLEEIMASESPATPSAVEKKAELEAPQPQPVETASLDQEAEPVQPEMAVEKEIPAAPSPAPAVAETQAIDEEALSQAVASLVPSPKPSEAMPPATPETQQMPPTTVVVIKVKKGSTLNVRATPSASGEVLGYLENGDMMPFTKKREGWHQIMIDDGLFGWVSSKFSVVEELGSDVPVALPEEATAKAEAPTAEESPANGQFVVEITVREGSTLNVRSLASSKGEVVNVLERGDTLPLLKQSGDWYQLQLEDGTTGWVSKKFSRLQAAVSDVPGDFPEVEEETVASADTSVPPAPAAGPITTVVVIQVKEGSSLTVRAAPSAQGRVLGRLKNGEMRPLLEESGEWYQVEFQDGQSGWVSSRYSAKQDQ